jgi:hypothetical protein
LRKRAGVVPVSALKRRPALRLRRANISPLGRQEVARVLEDGAATVEYVVAHDKLHIFVLTRRDDAPGRVALQVYTAPIDGPRLAAMIKKFRAQVGERDLGFAALSRELYDMLVAPVAAQPAGALRRRQPARRHAGRWRRHRPCAATCASCPCPTPSTRC